MSGWVDTLIQGVMLGGLYALFAMGLSLAFGVMRLVNVAHGDFIVLSAYTVFLVTEYTGMSPLLALILCMPVLFALGYLLQRHLLNRTLAAGIMSPLLVTFGLSMII